MLPQTVEVKQIAFGVVARGRVAAVSYAHELLTCVILRKKTANGFTIRALALPGGLLGLLRALFGKFHLAQTEKLCAAQVALERERRQWLYEELGNVESPAHVPYGHICARVAAPHFETLFCRPVI